MQLAYPTWLLVYKTAHEQIQPFSGRIVPEEETAKHVFCMRSAASVIRYSVLGKLTLQSKNLDETFPKMEIGFNKMLGFKGKLCIN